MKSIRTKILFLSIIIFVIACQSDKEQKFKIIESFQVNKKLVSQIVELDTMPNCPRYLFVAGKYLTLLNFDGCDKYHIHVFDKNTLQFMGAFGTNGRGPNELFAPIPRNVVNNDTLSGIWIYNQRHKKHELFDIEKSIYTGQYTVVSSSNEKYGPIRVVNDSLMNLNSEKKVRLPRISTSLSGEARTALYRGKIGLSSDNKVIVVAFSMAKRIDIYNNELDHQVSVSYHDSPENINFNSYEAEESEWHNTYGYFEEIYVDSQKRIFLLVHKRSLSGKLTDEYPEVHIFSMDGTALARFQLDINKVIGGFAIDDDNNNIFILTHDDEGFPQIIRYRIQELSL